MTNADGPDRSQSELPAYIDVTALLDRLWSAKWWTLGFSSVFAVVSILIAVSLPNVYRAHALLASNLNEGPAALRSLASSYDGIIGLPNIGLQAQLYEGTEIAIEVLKSRKFLAEFIERHDILVPLMAAKGWDRESDRLVLDEGVYDAAANKWIREVRPPFKAEPDLQEAYEKFIDDVLIVGHDEKTGLVHISVDHVSPNVAAEWANLLIRDLNNSIMEFEVKKAQRAIDYLKDQIEATSVTSLQAVFFGLIEEQTKTVMLANVSDDYVFRVIDPAVPPRTKARPSRVLIVVAGAMLGALLGLLAGALRR